MLHFDAADMAAENYKLDDALPAQYQPKLNKMARHLCLALLFDVPSRLQSCIISFIIYDIVISIRLFINNQSLRYTKYSQQING